MNEPASTRDARELWEARGRPPTDHTQRRARENGARPRAFAGFIRGTDLAAMVPPDNASKKVSDFRGKTLVCFAGSPCMPFLDLWLKAGVLDRQIVHLMLVDPRRCPEPIPLAGRTGLIAGARCDEAGSLFALCA